MRRLSACMLVAAIAGCSTCYPSVEPITVQRQPGAIVVTTINCHY